MAWRMKAMSSRTLSLLVIGASVGISCINSMWISQPSDVGGGRRGQTGRARQAARAGAAVQLEQNTGAEPRSAREQRSPVSRLPPARATILPANQDLSDHAS